MLKKELLVGGKSEKFIYPIHKDSVDTKVLPSGRNLGRHKNGEGCILTFDMFGRIINLFIPDAKHRKVARENRWSNTTSNIPALPSITTPGNIFDSGLVDKSSPLPATMDDSKLQSRFSGCRGDKTAKELCDLWVQHQGLDHILGEIRNIQPIGGISTFDVCNLYELVVCFIEADFIDSIDPSFSSNNGYGLGYKSGPGRFGATGATWCSSQVDSSKQGLIIYYGFAGSATRIEGRCAFPIKEI